MTDTFNHAQPYRVVAYLRMSSKQQNERSPDQQLNEIKRTISNRGLTWQIVKEYRDLGETGRLVHNRTGFKQMLREIQSGVVECDVVVVDTLERFGRHKGLEEDRRRLAERHGVLVLAADNGFEDPTSDSGELRATVDAMRARDHARVLAHNVRRGKRDAVEQRHWAGGTPPFGYRVRRLESPQGGGRMFAIIEPCPATAWIIQSLFERAVATGHGLTRLAKFLNDNPDIVDEHKKFHPSTIATWLDSPIYIGRYVFNKTSTRIVDDRKISIKNPEEDLVVIDEFCEPLVSLEVWQQVQKLRQERRKNAPFNREKSGQASSKLIRALSPGMTVRYMLSGLVRCESCGRRMTIASSQQYETLNGVRNRYAAFVCPSRYNGGCANMVRIPVDWLENIVADRIRHFVLGEAA